MTAPLSVAWATVCVVFPPLLSACARKSRPSEAFDEQTFRDCHSRWRITE